MSKLIYIYSRSVKHRINSGPIQTSKIEIFAKIVGNVNLKPLIILAKMSILDA